MIRVSKQNIIDIIRQGEREMDLDDALEWLNYLDYLNRISIDRDIMKEG